MQGIDVLLDGATERLPRTLQHIAHKLNPGTPISPPRRAACASPIGRSAFPDGLTFGSMMPATMIPRAVSRRTGSMGRLGNRNQGGIAQICREHQHQRRNDAEREKGVQRRQGAAQVGRRTGGKSPGDRSGDKTGQGGNVARSGRDLKPRPALRTHDIVRARRRFRR